MGITVELERNAGSDDRSKPGDLKILCWKEGRDLYIDVSCVNPMALTRRGYLARNGLGGAAEECAKRKINWYKDKIDTRFGDFLPFIMETQGGLGDAAKKFLCEVDRRKKQRSNIISKGAPSVANLDLMTTLSIELQRLNAEMILQRLPRDEILRVADRTKLECARRKAVHLAKEGLNATKEWKENLQLNQEISG